MAIRDTILLVSDIFGDNFINTGNVDKYFNESYSQMLGSNHNWLALMWNCLASCCNMPTMAKTLIDIG